MLTAMPREATFTVRCSLEWVMPEIAALANIVYEAGAAADASQTADQDVLVVSGTPLMTVAALEASMTTNESESADWLVTAWSGTLPETVAQSCGAVSETPTVAVTCVPAASGVGMENATDP